MISRRHLLAALSAGGGLVAGSGVAAPQLDASSLRVASPESDAFIARAIHMRRVAIENGDQPFGAVLVKDGRMIGEAPSRVVTNRDPTAHAEMEAIRDAGRRAGDLKGSILYSSSRPCSMCQAASAWVGVARLVYGEDATDGGPPRAGC